MADSEHAAAHDVHHAHHAHQGIHAEAVNKIRPHGGCSFLKDLTDSNGCAPAFPYKSRTLPEKWVQKRLAESVICQPFQIVFRVVSDYKSRKSRPCFIPGIRKHMRSSMAHMSPSFLLSPKNSKTSPSFRLPSVSRLNGSNHTPVFSVCQVFLPIFRQGRPRRNSGQPLPAQAVVQR